MWAWPLGGAQPGGGASWEHAQCRLCPGWGLGCGPRLPGTGRRPTDRTTLGMAENRESRCVLGKAQGWGLGPLDQSLQPNPAEAEKGGGAGPE